MQSCLLLGGRCWGLSQTGSEAAGSRQRRAEEEGDFLTGLSLCVFTADLDLMSIQLRHAVNAKRGICTASHLVLCVMSPAGRRLRCTPVALRAPGAGPGCKPQLQDGADCCTCHSAARAQSHACERAPCLCVCVCVSVCSCVGAMRTLIGSGIRFAPVYFLIRAWFRSFGSKCLSHPKKKKKKKTQVYVKSWTFSNWGHRPSSGFDTSLERERVDPWKPVYYRIFTLLIFFNFGPG